MQSLVGTTQMGNIGILLFLGLFLIVSTTATPSVDKNVFTDEFVKHINSVQNTWIAAPNPKVVANFRSGVLESTTPKKIKTKVFKKIRDDLPDHFDARENWPQCADIIGLISDQGACGSCWAAAAVSVISDRICIHSQANVKVNISLEDLVSCCGNCASYYGACNGGFTNLAWDYYAITGIVTGGGYQSDIGCKPYSIASCEHHVDGDRAPCGDVYVDAPACVQTCKETYNLNYQNDLHFASEIYSVSDWRTDDNELNIMQEIYENGPVEVDFWVYQDFLLYQSGIYQHVDNQQVGRHAVKILGWGEENGVKYWLIANSWNYDWGEQGYFRMIRGTNDCSIENNAIAGIPSL